MRRLISGQTILVIFDPPSAVEDSLFSLIFSETNTRGREDPFWIDALLLQEVVRLQHEAVWAIRNQVRDLEKGRTPRNKPDPDYGYLHEIERHAIHVLETIDLAIGTTDCILTQHELFMSDMPPHQKFTQRSKQIHQRLQFHSNMLNSLRHRSMSNKERLLNEIQLSFQTVAQYDAKISVKIGKAAQADSAAMKAVAFLTLTFLPATFTSAIFSMSFFNYDATANSWTMSDKFWLYWAVSVPITIVSATVWYYWTKLFPPEAIDEVEADKVDVPPLPEKKKPSGDLESALKGSNW